MRVAYDESVIHEFAVRLYNRAARIVVTCAVLGLLIGIGVAFPIASTPAIHGSSNGNAVYVLLALLGAVGGWAIGTDRAFALRLLAQTALCQAQIERNTRR
jgi:hypothetical protein